MMFVFSRVLLFVFIFTITRFLLTKFLTKILIKEITK